MFCLSNVLRFCGSGFTAIDPATAYRGGTAPTARHASLPERARE